MNYISRIRKRKKRHILILCPSSANSGMDVLYLDVSDTNWQILQSQSIHYPSPIKNLLQDIGQRTDQSCYLQDLAQLDTNMTIFLITSARKLLDTIPKLKRRPDLVVLKKSSLWQGSIENALKQKHWNIPLGDAHHVAQSLKLPVLTDFIRQDLLENRPGSLDTSYGDLIISQKARDIAVFINIGLLADMTVIDCQKQEIIINSDTGPGTCCIDQTAQEAGCEHGFDRDGSGASGGKVQTEALEILLGDKWFKLPSPKQGDSTYFKNLLQTPCLQELKPSDRLATITAFTALTISDFYKRELAHTKKPSTIWLSGGGINNLALKEFLTAYFAPTSVKSIEEMGIPYNSRVPLTLGLTVHGYLNQQNIYNSGTDTSKDSSFGRWVFP